MSQKKSKKKKKLSVENSKKQLLFQSVFVADGQLAKNKVKWKIVDSVIKGHDQKIYYQKNHIKAPLNWSATAIDIAASKYFRRTIKEENSIEALVERLGKGFSTAAKLSSLFQSSKQISSFVEELKYLMYSQKA